MKERRIRHRYKTVKPWKGLWILMPVHVLLRNIFPRTRHSTQDTVALYQSNQRAWMKYRPRHEDNHRIQAFVKSHTKTRSNVTTAPYSLKKPYEAQLLSNQPPASTSPKPASLTNLSGSNLMRCIMGNSCPSACGVNFFASKPLGCS
jgi:hypothetical protein